ncbi:hypothetical protein DPMN_088822 [Dreissena polymorpha]|uniref:Uncharacterized protein n=1 Tax=Dreissena polymorpha TaxID=45954 RepID=A0A9D4KV89_DREPO|nr:hypothetical protein DPMN_088822 [Dreissena polymorpha]
MLTIIQRRLRAKKSVRKQDSRIVLLFSSWHSLLLSYTRLPVSHMRQKLRYVIAGQEVLQLLREREDLKNMEAEAINDQQKASELKKRQKEK